ncbi:hypothetical protein DV737_g3445, partial [Chaetothyriales sp. CBS 132003]
MVEASKTRRHLRELFKAIIDGDRTQKVWTRASLYNTPYDFICSDDFSDDDESDLILTPDTVEDEDDPNELITESRDLHLSVNESITSLLRLSIQVHASSRKAKFARSSVDQVYSIAPDTNHARDFFPFASSNEPLITKLGKANAQRRQWLQYRWRHREKLSVDLSGQKEEPIPGFGAPEPADSESIAVFSVDDQPSGSILSGTKATTFKSHLTPSVLSQSGMPDTYFGRSSRAIASEQRLLVPKPPSNLVLGQPYLCRYCCKIIEISGKNAWQKHVHADLSSYTCVFDDCDEMFFESAQKWWVHEMEAHRKKWTCGMCDSKQPNFTAMKEHLHLQHSDMVPLDQIEDVAYRFGRPVGLIDAADCPLCDYTGILRRRGYSDEEIVQIPADKFGWHLARHLEQLALFVLPNADLVDEEEGMSGYGGHDHNDLESEADGSETGELLLTDPDLIQKLSEATAEEKSAPEALSQPPDLAMRWQPPHDFTPPLEDFDTQDVDLLPVRQEPIYGGDLHTPGWARGLGNHKEGFCARCPVSHWVNITDGSYCFHLTYFHGVPDSGVPLPRPSTIRGETPLMIAASQGFDSVVDLLLDLGADPNIAAPGEQTALDMATDAGYFTTAQKLVNGGADASKSHVFKKIFSNEREYAGEMTKRSTRLVPSSQINPATLTPLGRAAFYGDIDMTRKLLGSDSTGPSQCDIEEGAELGCSPFSLASIEGHFEIMDLLLARGANINATSKHGWTPLMLATKRKDEECVSYLISKGADVNHLSPDRWTALAESTSRGFTRIMARLLDAGADPEIRAQSDWTPLMHAAYRADIEAVDLLLGVGASFEEISARDETVMLLAAAQGSAEVVRRLLDAGCTPESMWSKAPDVRAGGEKEGEQNPLESGQSSSVKAQQRIERVYKVGWTPLMVACQIGSLEVVAMLLDAGANPAPKSPMFKTALEIAKENGRTEVAEYLMQRLGIK